jgi:hypothetical protein
LGEKSFFPRTTENSFLSKLYYLSNNKLDTIYFGSSRTEVGLPAYSLLGENKVIYNAGVTGMSFGKMLPFIKHGIALSNPDQVVIGVDFTSFNLSDINADMDFEPSLLTSNYPTYFVKRIFFEFSNALSFYAIENTAKSIRAFYNGEKYDGLQEKLSLKGQRTEVKMRSLIEDEGKGIKAFHETINSALKGDYSNSASDESIYKFNDLVKLLCDKKIATKIYIHPVHALTTDVLRQKGLWPKLEKWKAQLAKIASHNQSQHCSINIFDFSGYNSITTESVNNLSKSKTLKHYWEASHYKSEVGELILKRLFSKNDSDVPKDFGLELSQNTITHVLATIREEQSRYLTSHSEDIRFAQNN